MGSASTLPDAFRSLGYCDDSESHEPKRYDTVVPPQNSEQVDSNTSQVLKQARENTNQSIGQTVRSNEKPPKVIADIDDLLYYNPDFYQAGRFAVVIDKGERGKCTIRELEGLQDSRGLIDAYRRLYETPKGKADLRTLFGNLVLPELFEANMGTRMKNPDFHVLTLTDEETGEVIGWTFSAEVTKHPRPGDANLSSKDDDRLHTGQEEISYFVDPARQGEKLGSALVLAAIHLTTYQSKRSSCIFCIEGDSAHTPSRRLMGSLANRFKPEKMKINRHDQGDCDYVLDIRSSHERLAEAVLNYFRETRVAYRNWMETFLYCMAPTSNNKRTA